MTASPSVVSDQPETASIDEIYIQARARALRYGRIYLFPWWLAFILISGILIALAITADPLFARIFSELKQGIGMTLGVSFSAYLLALLFALFVGLIRSNPPAAPQSYRNIARVLSTTLHTIIYNVATIYVQVMRGIPILVILFAAAFAIVPAVSGPVEQVINASVIPMARTLLNDPEIKDFVWRGVSPLSAIIALAFTYGAYMSETVRAGIQSIPRGQAEAAYSIGMTYPQTMRYIVLPQAFRNVLPPLGNDLIAMIKDSSLVAALGINDMNQLAKKYQGSSFRVVETYLVLSYMYLLLVFPGSLIVQSIENTIREDRETPEWIKKLGRAWQTIRSEYKHEIQVDAVLEPIQSGDKERGRPWAMLLMVIVAANLLFLAILLAPDDISRLLFGSMVDSDLIGIGLILAQVVVIISTLAIWFWKQWGYAGIVLAYGLVILFSLISLNFAMIISSFAGLVIFVHFSDEKIRLLE
jgi:polar amino acid transport system permease protein